MMNSRYSFILVLGVIAFVGFFLSGCPSKDSNAPTPSGPPVEGFHVGNLAPDWSLRQRDGTVFTLSDHRGKVIFLNFWATWCVPCRVEMPAMEKLYQAFKDKPFVMVAVSEDEEGWPVVDKFVEEVDLNFTIVLDQDGKVSKKYRSFRFPETFIINKKGVIVDKRVGVADWDDPRYHQYFDKLVSESPTESDTSSTKNADTENPSSGSAAPSALPSTTP